MKQQPIQNKIAPRSVSETAARHLLTLYEPLLVGNLKHLHVHEHYSARADIHQAGRLALIEAYATFPGTLATEAAVRQFASYAYTRIRWAMLDELRRQEVRTRHQIHLSSDIARYLPQHADALADIAFDSWWREFFKLLTPTERHVLTGLVSEELTLGEAAARAGLSRHQASRLRKRLQQKWHDLQDAEEGEVRHV